MELVNRRTICKTQHTHITANHSGRFSSWVDSNEQPDDFRLPDQGALGNLCGHLKMALARCMESQIHSSGELLSEAAHAALQTLDERLHESLAEGTIRLLSIEWLLSQPEDWVWQNRQKLEELERSGTARPFLSREEAESALAAATRRIAVISHGWLTPAHPDPMGARLACLRPYLKAHPSLVGLFFE